MMDISHLYHDAAFGDPTLELDVKEQLKTREVNAREERNLQRMHKSYDKEMDICEKNTAWERWKVGQSLQGIWERSPRLEKRLAMEKARIEALERSILLRNFRRMNTYATDYSMASRSISSVTLKPLQDHKKAYQNKNSTKKKETFNRECDKKNGNNDTEGNERGIVRQADFVRRSEHSIKALAKLNWKQQNRRRDHEKFKEDLYFHSKPVFEKAKVVLKGRPDIDVETLHTDLESILLPPVKKPPNSNPKPQFKSSNSNLYERNVLRLGETVQRKRPPYLSPLAPVSENSEAHQTNRSKTELQTSVDESKQENHSNTTSNVNERLNPPTDDSSVTENKEIPSSSNPHEHSNNSNPNQKGDVKIDSEHNRLQDSYPSPTSSDIVLATTQQPQPNISPTSPVENDANSINDFTDSNSNITAKNKDQNTENPTPPPHHQQPVVNHPFSPSTSISQVIIEENEEDLEKDNEKTISGDELCPDINNNITTMQDRQEMTTLEENPGMSSAYTMTCTTGLPQLWKQTKKPKEVPPPEVSASAIARKHKRKRRDRW